ncbi:cytochrome c-type biogenesis protein [Methanococcus maripaludis]|uniref:Cytochrome c-type biogenesis protein n=1 Tax=Methanococcus maripaludis TaxID=39152 RepID=A0A7J9P5S3_METMI|nr:cytochrome c biogenesis CcdA family protein [Methanococcus maripaludis]MBA2858077.1 cytochrome c-type biogenesis protein [Methanococcus maripaludis]
MDLFLIFLAGISTALGPCIVTVLPFVLAYTFGISNSRFEGFLVSFSFMVGFSIVFSTLGVLSSAFGIFLNFTLLKYIAGIFAIIFGILVLFNKNFTFRKEGVFQKFSKKLSKMNDISLPVKILNSIVLGIVYGFGANICADPILAGILTYVASKADVYYGFFALLTYSLGYGIPIIFLSTLGAESKQIVEKIVKKKFITYISGIILIILGLFLIFSV